MPQDKKNVKPKTSQSQRQANKKYRMKNPELTRYLRKKSVAKNFILKAVKDEDLPLVKQWLEERAEKGLQD